MTEYKFEGWCGHGPESAKGQMKWGEYEPKTWSEDDVDIKISHCGICGSDLHMLRSGWYPTPYPCGSFYPDGKSKSYGGYANYNRTPSHFVFKIPEQIPSEHAAPIMCGGITLYS
jgi:alcohol dehydrogenase (NADP+)